MGSPKDDGVQGQVGRPGQRRGAGLREAQEQHRQVARQQGLSGKINASVTDDGLLIRLLTDKLLFDSGSAMPRPQSLPLLKDVAGLLSATQKTTS